MNHHEDTAELYNRVADDDANRLAPDVRQVNATQALTAATLALAYEQHTANLIAWFSGAPERELGKQITERLGLTYEEPVDPFAPRPEEPATLPEQPELPVEPAPKTPAAKTRQARR